MKDGLGQQPSSACGVDQRRTAMPVVAQFVDWARAAFGSEFVDQQLTTAQQARREYEQVLQTQGHIAAQRWHRTNAHRCTFVGIENGRTVGMPSPFGKNL